jgi:hypothetical protein
MLSNRQAGTSLGFMVALTILGGVLLMLAFISFGLGAAVISGLVFFILSVFIFVILLMYNIGALKRKRVGVVPQTKSRIKNRFLSVKNIPFTLKNGKESDVVLEWEVEKEGKKRKYVMNLWLDDKKNVCTFNEKIVEGKEQKEIGGRYRETVGMKKNTSLYVPSIWPNLRGKKDLAPEEARRFIWEICEESGWSMVRK